MASAVDVANLLIHRAAAEDEPEYLTQMRLHKLLYYVQGWSLALRNEPIFPERIEAWAHGPVVRDLYAHFAVWKDWPIPPTDTPEPKDISDEEGRLIESVWTTYSGYTALGLRQKTHGEPPWRNARRNAGPGEKSHEEITQQSMREYFLTLAK